MAVASITDKDFEREVLKAELPVLVDFWAEWCGPCKMISPIVDEISKELEGKLKVVKVTKTVLSLSTRPSVEPVFV